MEQARRPITLIDMAEFEIDHGEPERPSPRSSGSGTSRSDSPPPVLADAEQQQQQQASVDCAVTRIEAAGQRRHAVDILAFGLAAVGGTGLSGLPRIDPWTSGATVGLVAALLGIAHAAWRWRYTRLVADELWITVAPLDDAAIARIVERDPNRHQIEFERRATAVARVEELDGELTRCFRCFRLAFIGAAVGTLSGWMCAWSGPVGMMTMTGSVAALFGALLGWQLSAVQLSAVQLSPVMIQRVAIGGFVGCSVIPAVLGGTPLLYALGGGVAVGAGIFAARQHLTALLATATDNCAAADESAS